MICTERWLTWVKFIKCLLLLRFAETPEEWSAIRENARRQSWALTLGMEDVMSLCTDMVGVLGFMKREILDWIMQNDQWMADHGHNLLEACVRRSNLPSIG